MLGLEIVEVIILISIAIEGALLLYKKEDEEEHRGRRDIYGTFKNPLADSYRKNQRGQYVPIRPNEKMIEHSGDDE